ncbi:MAG: NAD(P)-dependent oxidoreductase, partial [Methylocella sp.]
MNEIFFPPGEDIEDRGPLMQGIACLPVFFSLAGKRVVLAGGSNAVLWKAELCQAAGARLDVFSPDPCSGLVALARRCPLVNLVSRRIKAEDFRGAALAIADAESAAEAAEFQAAARAACVVVNV